MNRVESRSPSRKAEGGTLCDMCGSGEDKITFRVLGGFHRRALEKLRDIFEVSIHFGEVPRSWKTTTIIFIPKGYKDPEVGELLESLVKEEGQEFIKENEIHPVCIQVANYK